MSRISSAFRSFFAILFGDGLPEDIAQEFGFFKPAPVVEIPKGPTPKDGALQLLGILQRDSRLIDFLMEDIGAYEDDQVGAAVRNIHSDARACLDRHISLRPVVDSVEGTFQKLDPSKTPDPNRTKLLGNIPASGKVAGGVLRHRGWKAELVTLPEIGKSDPAIVAPAEIEVE